MAAKAKLESLPLVLVEIPLDAIEPHPANARTFPAKDLDDAGLVELARLLALGRAMRLVPGATTIAAIVRDVGDREALEILVTENLQRKDLSPLEEAAGVKALVDQAGWTIQDVADRLGRSLHWVALRAHLTNLSPKWQAQAANPKSPISEWPAGHLGIVARLEPDAQDGLLAGGNGYQHELGTPRRADVERHVAGLTRELRKAPWKLVDEGLWPEAGACTACQKRSACHPGLFEDQDIEKPDSHDRCLDPVCWAEKAKRLLAVKESVLRAEHGKIVLLHGDWEPGGAQDRSRRDVVHDYQIAPAKKGEDGAVPALLVDGRGMGSVRWVKPRRENSGGRSSPRPRDTDGKPAPRSLKERRELLGRRRKAHAVQAIRALIENAATPGIDLLVRLAAVFGTWHKHDSAQWSPYDEQSGKYDTNRTPAGDWKLLAKLDTQSVDGTSSLDLLWRQVRRVLAARLNYLGSATDMKKLWSDAEHVCEVLDLDAAAMLQEATAAIPEPKSWAGLKVDGTPKAMTDRKLAKSKAPPKEKGSNAHKAEGRENSGDLDEREG